MSRRVVVVILLFGALVMGSQGTRIARGDALILRLVEPRR